MYGFWIWPLILGLFLIILSGLLAGGLHETNPWIWTAFIVGAILTLIGVVLAIISWSKEVRNVSCVSNVSNVACVSSSSPDIITSSNVMDYSNPVTSNSVISNQVTSNPVTSNSLTLNEMTSDNMTSNGMSSPIDYNVYRYASPIGTPTPIGINIPQAQRGFSATNVQISSLGPEM